MRGTRRWSTRKMSETIFGLESKGTEERQYMGGFNKCHRLKTGKRKNKRKLFAV